MDRETDYKRVFKFEMRRMTRILNEPAARAVPTHNSVDLKIMQCIMLEHSIELVHVDVFSVGYVRCGTSLFKCVERGIAQGSPLVTSLAD